MSPDTISSTQNYYLKIILHNIKLIRAVSGLSRHSHSLFSLCWFYKVDCFAQQDFTCFLLCTFVPFSWRAVLSALICQGCALGFADTLCLLSCPWELARLQEFTASLADYTVAQLTQYSGAGWLHGSKCYLAHDTWQKDRGKERWESHLKWKHRSRFNKRRLSSLLIPFQNAENEENKY